MSREDVLAIAATCHDVPGEFWECGVHRGTTAKALRDMLQGSGKTLRLFDTFQGRPAKGPYDQGRRSSETTFEDTSFKEVHAALPDPFIAWHIGLIPDTFEGLDGARIAFAYVDLDLYESTRAALLFVLPRMHPGGAVVVDDYQHPKWPGVTRAVHQIGRKFEQIGYHAVLR